MKKVISKRQRGAVAVEFALVFPLFLAVTGFGVSVGLYLIAQAQMMDISSTAARYCAFNLPQVSTTSAMTDCASNYITTRLASSSIPVVGCNAGTVQQNVTIQTPNNVTVPNMKILSVTLTCTNTWYGIMDAIGSDNRRGDRTISVTGAMPFITL